MNFDIIGNIENVETIAISHSIKIEKKLIKLYGSGRWRKLKGVATVLFKNGAKAKAELHWYEAHGIGKVDYKIKRIIYYI